MRPISFSIPDARLCAAGGVLHKTRAFATCVPGDPSTYVFRDQDEYYRDMQASLYAVTTVKGGWDCLRHYEILANRCVPYFVDLDQCPPRTLANFPKDLVLRAMRLPGVSRDGVDMSAFPAAEYLRLLDALWAHTRAHLTSSAVARNVLTAVGHGQPRSLLFIGSPHPDYQCTLLLVGLKTLLGAACVDVPRPGFVYDDADARDVASLYGRGFTYTRVVPAAAGACDRADVEGRIRAQEFDLVVYGSFHRNRDFWEVVQRAYPPDRVVLVCGEDAHEACPLDCCPAPHRFRRELR